MSTAEAREARIPAAEPAIDTNDAGPLACPVYPPEVQSLPGALAHQLRHLGDRDVCHRIERDRRGFVSDTMTLAELLERAGSGAARLRAAGVAEGDRVILSLSDPLDFLLAFCSVLGAGASAVPLPTVAESGAPRSFAARVRAVSVDCAPRAAIVEGGDRFAAIVGAPPRSFAVLEPRGWTDTGGASLALRDPPPEAAAFIQYTSGSTGTPKGVVVTHRNLMENCRAIRDATAYTRADRMVSWLPLHHDMGLVGGLLTSLYCAAETWLMPPLAFVGRPVTWLEAITRYAATLTVGPTFAYSLCARKVPEKQLRGVDLSTLRLAYIGAEPIDPGTVDAFVARFAPYGLSPNALYPVYGLAEATLAVAFPRPGSLVRRDSVDRGRLAAEGVAVPAAGPEADPATFVSVGQALPRHRVTIVDPGTHRPLGERRVGELVFEGTSVTPRYFGDDDPEDRARLHTGDLAYEAEGHLYIVDRIKDLIIVAGQNHAPSDLESVVAGVPGVRRGCIAAFSAAGREGTEEMHVVAEADPNSWRRLSDTIAAVHRALRQQVRLSPASVTIVAPGTLERTSSGKIKRRACAEAWKRGALAPARRRDLVLHRLRRASLWIAAWIAHLPPRGNRRQPRP